MRNGKLVSTSYTFTNHGNYPLEIEIVSACFCISTDWPTNLIHPGEKGTISIVFDSNDQVGNVKKDIDVIFTNTDKQGYPLIKRLTLRGKVTK